MGFFKRAVALGKGVAFEVAVMLDEVLGLLARDGQVFACPCLHSRMIMGVGASSSKPVTVQTPCPG